jgi:1-acyl-sn-glycerol-3-phosphate acyltransferase
MNPAMVRLSRLFRRRRLRRDQRIESIETPGIERLHDAVSEGQGVLLIANHSAHYDSEALYAAMDDIGLPLYFMVAWQVFGMATPLQRWALQRVGCFSVDREGSDRQAFKQAVQILQKQPYPLVIFPEGDIYHTADRVTPFRDGAAAIALSAARRADRPIVIQPCGIKFWYLEDPTPQLQQLLTTLEERVLLRPLPDWSLKQRVLRLGEAVLALKELDYVGATQKGKVPERIANLTESVLSRLENKYHRNGAAGNTPERVKAVRQEIIKQFAGEENSADGRQRELGGDMDDLFFVMQLYSHPGDYLSGRPSIERIAETLDKIEEDLFQLDLPNVRGRRRVVIQFGEPIEVPRGDKRREAIAELTGVMRQSVQDIIDELNARASESAY